ncbi:hypothetical protein [Eupransor demetentiae]|uniref:YtxH domain-containing protein n=1 Tax=Eupransor demetentiae TaxID=3109584 RepID=A0ABM9N653_9LACO|nr:hypothetical protein R54876_GBNLAHCA_01233 [Lactobacillaceae bacterium LMG 33000]
MSKKIGLWAGVVAGLGAVAAYAASTEKQRQQLKDKGLDLYQGAQKHGKAYAQKASDKLNTLADKSKDQMSAQEGKVSSKWQEVSAKVSPYLGKAKDKVSPYLHRAHHKIDDLHNDLHDKLDNDDIELSSKDLHLDDKQDDKK